MGLNCVRFIDMVIMTYTIIMYKVPYAEKLTKGLHNHAEVNISTYYLYLFLIIVYVKNI